MKGKWLGNNEWQYSCVQCGEVFTSNKKSLIGADKLCDICREEYERYTESESE